MARGSIVWRCGVCGKPSGVRCKHAGGRYAIIYPIQRWDPVTGKVVKGQKWEKVPLNAKGRAVKDIAETLLAERLNTVHDGSYRELQEITFAAFADKWLKEYALGGVKLTTYQGYDSHIKFHFKPALGALPLRAISESMLQGYLATKLKDGAAPKSVKNHLILLKMMLRHAVRWGYLGVNPAADIKAPRIERQEMDILQPKEVADLLTGTKEEDGKPFIPTGWYVAIKLAIFSGLRQGEQFGLKIGDLDFHAGQVRVRRGLTWDQKHQMVGDPPKEIPRWRLQSPKTKTAIRNVDLAPDLIEDLRRYVAGIPDPDPERFLFSTSVGTPLDPKNVVDRVFKKALIRAELRSLRWHDLRHTYASLQLEAGANIKYLSQQMGHASVQITLDRYSHLLKDENRAQAGRLSALVFDQPAPKTPAARGAVPANGSLTALAALAEKTPKEAVTLASI